MSKDLRLPERLDTASARRLAANLAGLRGQPAVLDGGAVAFGGALGLQVLVAARRQWRDDDRPFRIAAPSHELLVACRILGIDPKEIGVGDPIETEETA